MFWARALAEARLLAAAAADEAAADPTPGRAGLILVKCWSNALVKNRPKRAGQIALAI
jgi:hypothetical protein